jgi:hypothetical protein
MVELTRPILALNLVYWICILFWIIRTQNDSLFSLIFSVPLVRAAIASTLILHVLVYLVRAIDVGLSIELLSANKREINLNLLRLSGEGGSTWNIHW